MRKGDNMYNLCPDTKITKHALDRAHERNIPVNEVLKQKSSLNGSLATPMSSRSKILTTYHTNEKKGVKSLIGIGANFPKTPGAYQHHMQDHDQEQFDNISISLKFAKSLIRNKGEWMKEIRASAKCDFYLTNEVSTEFVKPLTSDISFTGSTVFIMMRGSLKSFESFKNNLKFYEDFANGKRELDQEVEKIPISLNFAKSLIRNKGECIKEIKASTNYKCDFYLTNEVNAEFVNPPRPNISFTDPTVFIMMRGSKESLEFLKNSLNTYEVKAIKERQEFLAR